MNRVDNFLRPVSVSVLNKERRASSKRAGNVSRASASSTNKVATPGARDDYSANTGGAASHGATFTQ